MVPVQINLLGGFEASLGSGEALELKGRKTRALVAYLAISAGIPMVRDELVALLWSDRGEAQARSSLRQCLTELRKALGERGQAALVAGRDTVMLDATAVSVDATKFESLVNDGSPAALEDACALYRGDLLQGIGALDPIFEDWLRDQRRRLQERGCDALNSLLEHLTKHDTERAIATAQRLLQLDPLREAAHRTLMQLYADKGERTRALEQYRICSARLRAELGLEPELASKQLAEGIRKGAAQDSPIDNTAGEPLPLPDKPSVAVLPFANLSGDPEETYFADGISEDIITELSRFDLLFVIARNSSFLFREQAVALSEVGQKLGVRYLVEGSVRRAGTRVRVTAQLIEAASGHQLWADRYDRELEDIFALQDEVVQAIVATLAKRVSAAEVKRTTRHPIADMAVYDLILRAHHHMGIWTKEDCIKSVELSRRAVALDPNCAQAHGTLAWCTACTTWFDWEDTMHFAEAKQAGKRALDLDPHIVEAHTGIAHAHLMSGEHDQALPHFETAVRINPNNANAVCHLAYCRALMGNPRDGVALIRHALRLNPYPPDWYHECLGEILYMVLDYSAAVEAFNRMHHKASWTYGYMAACFAQMGQCDAALTAVQTFRNAARGGRSAEEILTSDLLMYWDPAINDHWLNGYRKAGLRV